MEREKKIMWPAVDWKEQLWVVITEFSSGASWVITTEIHIFLNKEGVSKLLEGTVTADAG